MQTVTIDRVLVTVTKNNAPSHDLDLYFMNRTLWTFQGDMTNLDNIMNEHKILRSFINGELNRSGKALRDYTIKVETQFRKQNVKTV